MSNYSVSKKEYLDINDPITKSMVNDAAETIRVVLDDCAKEILRKNPQIPENEHDRFLNATKNTIYRDADWK